MRIRTLAVHAGAEPDPATGAVIPPLHLSATFERDADGAYSRGFTYSRGDNPNRRALERCLAALEGGADAVAFASGSAATGAVLQCLEPGDHVVLPDDVYHGTARLARDLFGRWGLAVTAVDMTDPGAVAAALGPRTRLVWVETPSNPLLKITPIADIADAAHRAGALCVCDNTFATPVLQRPFDHGADATVHATTKYLGGHSDMVGGAVVVRERSPLAHTLRAVQGQGGAVPSPFDCWLARRGIRTLALRMQAHCTGAQAVAEFLAGHPAVEAVHYPGLPGHPGHGLACRQMTGGFGGMLSVQLRGGREAAMTAASRVRVFIRATSLGGTESLIEHRASVEGPKTRTPDNLLRLSVGIEDPLDLIADLREALASAG
jgi:cystathionine gamma-synthase